MANGNGENGNGNGKAFEVEAGPVKVKTKGYHLGNILQMLVAGILALAAGLLWDIRTDIRTNAAVSASTDSTRDALLAKTVKDDHNKILHEMEKHNTAQEEMNYILTLSPADRERLRLRMPESLRRKLADR